jgi:hypothetical protein
MRAVWFLIVVGANLAACGDECRDGESHCEDGHLVSCTERNDGTLAYRDQGACTPATCVETQYDGEPVAACSTTGAPDLACDQPHSTVGYYVCSDPSTLVYCIYGYSSFAETCRPVTAGVASCVESTTGGTCQ